MKRAWYKIFLSPDGGGGAGGGTSDGGDGGDGQEGGDAKGSGDGEPKKGEDVTGLKSALEKERLARKELQQQLKELRDLSGKGEEAAKELEKLQKKLAEFEFKEARGAALEKAIGEATKDGKFSVDREKAAKLAAKLGNGQSLEADVAEIVELLKVEAPVGGAKDEKKGDPPFKGQPPKHEGAKGEVPYAQWAELKRTDPEAYKRMIEERRKQYLS